MEDSQNQKGRQRTPSTFSQVSNKYLQYCVGRFQQNTYRQKAFVYRMFLSFIGQDPNAEEISAGQIADYLTDRMKGSGNTAANRDLRDLKALFNWAIKQKDFVLNENPCEGVEKYPENMKPKYVPPAEDVTKVLMAAGQEDMDLLLVLYHCAARIGEILQLTWEDVNFEKGWIALKTRKRKGGNFSEDKLAMTKTLFAVLKRRWDKRNKFSPWVFCNEEGNRFKYSNKRNLMRNLCRKAGVKQFGFHAIRHHVASLLADSEKAGIGQIQKLLRHKRTSTTDNYINSLDPQAKLVADLLDDMTHTEMDIIIENQEQRVRSGVHQ